MISEMKVTLVCTKCGEEKSTEEFSKSSNKKSGFHSQCKACRKIYRQNNKEDIAAKNKLYNQENKEKLAAKNKLYNQENKEKLAEYMKLYRQENREEINGKKKTYRQENKEQLAVKLKKWGKENPHLVRAKTSRRRASKLQATPTWTTQLQKLQIESLYNEAVNLERSTGVKYEIDHFHPLNSKYICGLHLPINLQPLSQYENGSKSNKFECYVESELDPEDLKPWQCFYPVLYIDISESA